MIETREGFRFQLPKGRTLIEQDALNRFRTRKGVKVNETDRARKKNRFKRRLLENPSADRVEIAAKLEDESLQWKAIIQNFTKNSIDGVWNYNGSKRCV
jgi:hypothetical protein